MLVWALLPLPSWALAQNSEPSAQPIVDTIPPARDVALPGVLQLAVDASDDIRGIIRVRETIPVGAPGPLVLLYPKWLPGVHSPAGPIASLAGVQFAAGGHSLSWRRDPVDVYAFHVDVPPGTAQVELQFQFLTPTDASQGRISSTPEMLDLQWNTVVLYPAGYYARRVHVEPSLKLPEGWQAGTALELAGREGSTIR